MKPEQSEVHQTRERLRREAESGGYHLNPDPQFTLGLVKGLLTNQRRYGYRACPCRLASGSKAEDLDIICPCDYRDPDLDEYGTCYCALYVSQEVLDGKRKLTAIPERRPPEGAATSRPEASPPEAARPLAAGDKPLAGTSERGLPYPIWRCRVCGYLCARDAPPEVCPICKAQKERFERFL